MDYKVKAGSQKMFFHIFVFKRTGCWLKRTGLIGELNMKVLLNLNVKNFGEFRWLNRFGSLKNSALPSLQCLSPPLNPHVPELHTPGEWPCLRLA